jgi:hypothetical protein
MIPMTRYSRAKHLLTSDKEDFSLWYLCLRDFGPNVLDLWKAVVHYRVKVDRHASKENVRGLIKVLTEVAA